MKKNLFTIAILSCNFLNAQSNLFPATGNVGIGTTTPTEKLEVNSGNIFLNSAAGQSIRWSPGSYAPPSFVTRSAGTKLVLWPGVNTGTTDFAIGIDTGTIWQAVPENNAIYSHKFYGGTTPLMTIRGDGNVGIGTISPVQKLTVSGGHIGLDNKSVLTAKNTSGVYENVLYGRWDNDATYLDGGIGGLYLRTNNGLIPNQFLSTNGNTGIGTTNPVQKLTVSGGNIGLDNQGTLAAKTTLGTYENVLYGRWVNDATYLDGGAGGTYLRTANGNMINQYLSTNGNVGIGTINPAYKLDVVGTIRAREIRVNLDGADFVFEDGYKLMPLNELEKFVKQNKHLPEIAPAKEMQEKGSDLGSLSVQLLQKIEELTLHVIEQNKKMNIQNKEINFLKEKIGKLEKNQK